jgi:trehalose/maltose hydrolase-like predicted phosphorylase
MNYHDLNRQATIIYTMERKIHHGKNIARFRQMLGMKQDTLATLLHHDWTQVNISRLEAKEEIDDALLSQVSAALKIPVEAIKHFDEEAAIVNIQNNYDGSTLNHSANYQHNHQPTFNPIDKLVELMEDNKKLYEELLKEKEERIKLLERMGSGSI